MNHQQEAATIERRAQFKELIKEVTEGRSKEVIQSNGGVNALLMQWYRAATGREDFRTFKAWKEAGYKVKKGERGHAIFSRPIDKIRAEQGKEVSTGDRMYFATCYLFHDGQVEKIGGTK